MSDAASAEISIVRGGAERIPDLRPLWESLHRHHAEVALELAQIGPVRSGLDSWGVRKDLYAEWLDEPDAFVLVAEAGRGAAVGYALVHMRGPEETWATDDRIAELETLAVLPAHRGRPGCFGSSCPTSARCRGEISGSDPG